MVEGSKDFSVSSLYFQSKCLTWNLFSNCWAERHLFSFPTVVLSIMNSSLLSREIPLAAMGWIAIFNSHILSFLGSVLTEKYLAPSFQCSSMRTDFIFFFSKSETSIFTYHNEIWKFRFFFATERASDEKIVLTVMHCFLPVM